MARRKNKPREAQPPAKAAPKAEASKLDEAEAQHAEYVERKAAEDRGAVPAPKPEPEAKPKFDLAARMAEVPTMEACLAQGFTSAEAAVLIAGARVFARGPIMAAPVTAPAYVVTCPREIGMWRCGRKFTQEPTTVLISDLSADECAILEAQKPTILRVVKINF